MRFIKAEPMDLLERSRRLLCKLNFSGKREAIGTDKKGLFCSKPFKWFEVFSWNEVGEVYLCCAGWLDTSIGNLRYQSVEEVWNSEKAQEIRGSILDGSFKFCNQTVCPYLQTGSGPVSKVEDVRDRNLRVIIKKGLRSLPYGPIAINCSYDKSCNLSCPSCRLETIIEWKNEKNILDIQSKIQNEALKDAHLLYMSGIGDPFGSPFSKKWLQTMKREDMPKLREIFLQTNAQLWTPQMWRKIPKNIQQLVKSTEISIDAATSETYSINRRGGSFDRLLANLSFISQLRKVR
jgi:MoaA/NifB/PqqE/SkfB family radical SAM enzyme